MSSLEHIWGILTGKMPPKQAKKTITEKSLPCQDGNNVGDTFELNPALAKGMEVMTAIITTEIDDKLARMLHTINSNISQHKV